MGRGKWKEPVGRLSLGDELGGRCGLACLVVLRLDPLLPAVESPGIGGREVRAGIKTFSFLLNINL